MRALVVGGEVVASMRRKAHGSEFRSNFHLGGSVSNIELNEEQREIAIRASETMGLEIAGVDMLLSDRGPLVLEVNSSPGLEGIEAATRSNVAGKVAERLSELYTPPEESAARPGDLEGEAGSAEARTDASAFRGTSANRAGLARLLRSIQVTTLVLWPVQ